MMFSLLAFLLSYRRAVAAAQRAAAQSAPIPAARTVANDPAVAPALARAA